MSSFTSRQIASSWAGAFAVVLACATAARADIVVSDPSLPPVAGLYQSADGAVISYGGGAVVATSISHFGFSGVVRQDFGADEGEAFDSTLTGVVVVPAVVGIAMQGQTATIVFGKVGNTTGSFDTEMLSMSLAGFGLLIRESPTLASTGHTTITDLGGGQFQIASFFDVFTELSLDGGQTFLPSDGATRLTLVPEPGTLALCGLGAALLARSRRRGLRHRGDGIV